MSTVRAKCYLYEACHPVPPLTYPLSFFLFFPSDWLTSPSLNLNLSLAETAQLNDNVLYHIEAFRPRKADALAYLADPGHVAPPERYARVTINHGAAKEPYIMDYLVGPLPQVSVKGNLREEERKTNMTMTELKDIYHRDDIPFNARGFVNMAEISTLFMKIMLPLAPVTSVSCFLRLHNLNPSTQHEHAHPPTPTGPIQRHRHRPGQRHPHRRHGGAL
jgi:hypothetical protein